MFSLAAIMAHTGPIGLAVMILLLLFSIISWAVIFAKWFVMRGITKSNSNFIDTFWRTKDLNELAEDPSQQKSPSGRVFREGVFEYEKLKQKGRSKDEALIVMERSLSRYGRREIRSAESNIAMLATIGSISPFIGLFGTVIGIMSSFQEIASHGNASLSTVAPGIAEALFATALGLFAAIPAVMAYNFFQSKLRALKSDMDHFCQDLMAVLRSQK